MPPKSPATPVPASTILLLRDGQEQLEVFMVVRHHQIDFASGALVFPGGKIDPQDEDPEVLARCDGSDDRINAALKAGAIREAFEESGVLLARPRGGSDLITGTRLATMAAQRDGFNDGSLTLADFLKNEDLTLATDLLVPFAHWVTPDMMPKRFDTYFYIVRVPEDHILSHDGSESVDSVWIAPATAFAEAEAGTRTVIFPTLRNVEKLAHSKSVEEALSAAQATPVVTVLPWTERRDDGNYLCIPVEAGYDISEELMPERPA